MVKERTLALCVLHPVLLNPACMVLVFSEKNLECVLGLLLSLFISHSDSFTPGFRSRKQAEKIPEADLEFGSAVLRCCPVC